MMKYLIKNFIKKSLGFSFKVYSLIFKPFNGRNIILMYHRVSDVLPVDLYDSAMYVSTKTLEMHVSELSKHFEILPIQNINTIKSNNSSCVITFDDGWEDNYLYAYPILKKHNVASTIFLTVNMIGTKKSFWFHDIWKLANDSTVQGVENEFLHYFSELTDWDSSQGINEESIYELVNCFKNMSYKEIDEIILNAYKSLQLTIENKKILLDWGQVDEMERNGITFGSHGLNHFILTNVPDDVKKTEILDSYEILKNKGIIVCPYFCYPNGNWDQSSINYLKNSHYSAAVSTNLGCNTDKSDPFVLNRIALHDDISNTPNLLWYRLFQAYLGARN